MRTQRSKHFRLPGLLFFIFLAGHLLVSCKPNTSNTIQNITAAEFKERIQNSNGIILDVRTPTEVTSGYIEGASFININDADFERKISLMQKDKPVFVYCRSGGRSTKAAEFMLKNGFREVYNLTGGTGSWSDAQLPLVKPKNRVDENIKQMSVSEFDQVLQSQKIVFVEFHTLWCSPCIKMAPIVDSLQESYKGKIEIMRVDLDVSQLVAEKHSVSGVPTFILFKNGVEEWRKLGEVEESVLKTQLDDAL
ncbi:MAG: thioredoxin domain-containing protein [Leptospirales bacterium]